MIMNDSTSTNKHSNTKERCINKFAISTFSDSETVVSSALLVVLSAISRTGFLGRLGALLDPFETLFQDKSAFKKLASSRPTVLIMLADTDGLPTTKYLLDTAKLLLQLQNSNLSKEEKKKMPNYIHRHQYLKVNMPDHDDLIIYRNQSLYGAELVSSRPQLLIFVSNMQFIQ